MGPRYLRVRSWLRSWGVLAVANRLITFPARLSASYYRRRYQRTRPTSVTLRTGHISAQIAVLDAEHYVALCNHRERAVLRCLAELVRPGDVVWDVGANVGLYTVMLGQLVGDAGRVVAFEPSPAAQQALQANLQLNALANVHTYRLALGNAPGMATLAAAGPVTTGTHRLVAAASDTTELLDVAMESGDHLAVSDPAHAPLPNLVKIDVEGAEEAVLSGMESILRTTQCRAVMVEVHFGLLDAAGQREAPLRMLAFLHACGFDIQRWPDSSHVLAQKRTS